MKEISILIPTFNDRCVELVSALHQQAEELSIDYEIIVADDGSTDAAVKDFNRQINDLPHCRVEERQTNAGRAAIRNFLAQQARYDWLLLMDSDMVACSHDFLKRYLETTGNESVVDGGIIVRNVDSSNLRACYEQAAERKHTVERRQLTPYQHVHTANLLMRRDILLQYPFDERLRHYGYEDVLWGKQLQQAGITIRHIDNPLSFEIFETNEQFLLKTEEGLRTLHQFSTELQGYSSLLALSCRLRPIAPLIRLWHRLNRKWERRQLTGPHPRLSVFNIYRLGYFMSLP